MNKVPDVPLSTKKPSSIHFYLQKAIKELALFDVERSGPVRLDKGRSNRFEFVGGPLGPLAPTRLVSKEQAREHEMKGGVG